MKPRLKKIKELSPKFSWLIVSVGGAVLIYVVIYGTDSYRHLEKEKINIFAELEESRGRNAVLLSESRRQRAVIDSFQGQITNIGRTIGTLEKLAATDEELLKKYSKVYFLNENYVPAALADIDEKYVYEGSENFLIHAKVWPYLRKFLEEARLNDSELLIASAFRSFNTQSVLKSNYTVTYGSGANQFSADQGYSEHQLGTAVDFTTPAVGGIFSKFQADPAYQWLEENAHKYGFILSYPEGNTYYKFEPWHWRFVGISLASRLNDEEKYFYDLDQREIDKYLVNLFD